jgi:hypothetical protein
VVVLAVGLAGAAGLVAAVSCIPDLPSTGAPDGAPADQATVDQGGPEAGQPRCGDGIVQLDAGEQCDPPGSAGCGASCLMQCDGGFVWKSNNHCYEEQLAADSLTNATTRCGVGPHVVTFASDDELAAVTGAIDAGAFWVGLLPADPQLGQPGYSSLASYEPGWSPTCSGCFAHTPIEPLPADGGCVRGFGDLARSWEQIPCIDGGLRRVICEREPVGRQSTPCEAGVCIELVWTVGMKRYVYVHDVAKADDAENDCRSMGGTLVVLQSRDEREQLWRELSRLPPGNGGTPAFIWIGLSLADGGSPDAGPWVWDDDAAADAYPSPWGDGQPSGVFGRAYLTQNIQLPPIDDSLGRNALRDPATKFQYVCQLPP